MFRSFDICLRLYLVLGGLLYCFGASADLAGSLITTKRELRCGTVFSNLSPPSAKDSYVFANDVMVTGGDLYPIQVIRRGLWLTSEDLTRLRGKRVLSVAEGYSNFLPFLRKHGVEAEGLDLWYHSGEYPDTSTG